eukprot:CAMPEP_0197545880 /NCGR_PEP_ID=MMETSP1320-20131121/742_1 /TAXON_ID=91990 /ORGANISM="Bolidomonas sp., Strain RCC2347" /LENGTH=339 /DNA_ID=CAMNT_0043105421 /DNA_START=15 /DNA_END=1031 /DNA_ORIENTATION=+
MIETINATNARAILGGVTLVSAVPMLLYALWFMYSRKYHTLRSHVPWRRHLVSWLIFWDHLIFTKLLGMDRKLHFSLCSPGSRSGYGPGSSPGLRGYAAHPRIAWCASPHHLLLPSFAFAFTAERDGIHSQMGVNLDDIFTAAAKVLFYVPVLRELVITLGGRVASPEVLDGMKMFALAPGGIHEMIRQGSKVDRVYLRTGFVRFALKKELDICPIYLFDENECYKPIDGLPNWLVTFQRWCHRRLGVGFSIWRGRWNVPFNPLPYPCEYVVGVGKPIDTRKHRGMEDRERAIEEVMELYIEEVRRLFKELQEDTGRRKDVVLEIERLKSRQQRGLVNP